MTQQALSGQRVTLHVFSVSFLYEAGSLVASYAVLCSSLWLGLWCPPLISQRSTDASHHIWLLKLGFGAIELRPLSTANASTR